MRDMSEVQQILRGFAVEFRHLGTPLNTIASDMIRDRTLIERLRGDPDYFRRAYSLPADELAALCKPDLLALYHMGLHPFLLVRFAGMMGILEYWNALGSPGRAYESEHPEEPAPRTTNATGSASA
jgi:hypothetical protein